MPRNISTTSAVGKRKSASGNTPPADDASEDAAIALFRDAVKDAQPIRRIERVLPPAPAIPPIPVQFLIDEGEALIEFAEGRIDADNALDTGEEASYVRDGVSRTVLRKLRRGQWVLQGELDLHGATREEARRMLGAFLHECIDSGRRCVRIIHGKGLGSKNREPVLKGKVKHWLMQRDEVLAYCQAPPIQGGGGAMLVLLRG
jgi:DNA-nicking Smr family endonuclease